MAVLTEDELIKIRRHLHEIPELAIQEKETHAYLLEVIQNFKQDYLTIKTPESLPTALLVLVKGDERATKRVVCSTDLRTMKFTYNCTSFKHRFIMKQFLLTVHIEYQIPMSSRPVWVV